MITKTNLPGDYAPYKKLNFCSNIIEGGGDLIEVSGEIPILVGRGNPPMIWLSAKQGDTVKLIVEASKPKFGSVTTAEVLDGIVVMSNGVVLLSARQISGDEAEVSEIDLRPIGLNILGDKSGLQVGNSHFSRNHVVGSGTMIAIR